MQAARLWSTLPCGAATKRARGPCNLLRSFRWTNKSGAASAATRYRRPTISLGSYCDRHFAALSKPNRGFWRAGLMQLVLIGIFSAVVALLANYLGPLDRTALLLFGIFLAVVPSALWLAFFYDQDRLEPEPKTQIAKVFLLALLLTDVLALRLFNDWFALAATPAETSARCWRTC